MNKVFQSSKFLDACTASSGNTDKDIFYEQNKIVSWCSY